MTGIFGKNLGLVGAKAECAAGAAKELFAMLQPMPRAGVTDDVAQAAAFVAGDGSGFVNGHDLAVDGGVSIVGRGWSAGIALRAELYGRIQTMAADLQAGNSAAANQSPGTTRVHRANGSPRESRRRMLRR